MSVTTRSARAALAVLVLLLVAAFAPVAAVMIASVASRVGSPRAGGFAALVYLTTPWVYRLAVLPYVEGPLAAYHAGLVWAAWLAWARRYSRKYAAGFIGARSGYRFAGTASLEWRRSSAPHPGLSGFPSIGWLPAME